MRLLVTGAAGLLGREVVRLAEHDVVPTYHSTPVDGGVRLDVRDQAEVDAVIQRVRPDAIIHAAFKQSDWVTTANGPANLALAARDIRLVFVSTDAVFGSGPDPYDEDAAPCPTTPYGAAKAAAETAIRAIHPNAVIARTSLIVGSEGMSESERLAHALVGGASGALFAENIRCPVHVTDLATALLELTPSDRTGVVHLGGPEAVSRLELGRLIAVRDGLDPEALPALPGAISHIRLDSTRTQQVLKTRLRPVSEFLRPLRT
ncbi:sugar nucleotide-binding protein [Kribbella albertanoniae]|uniref:NAD-dependent epimerase/dehydratase family protein n=1 Tax=Kribbella albertanoniae TaxID=1266829 RepID=A0A4R4QC79_9ACTN|nr:sugar nucleotide-binding protein [Kribbella albertanoniae]TDC33076.1 NAD-dependent epimerase/dehydratase family protein [Kribbella albertanoniae]